MSPGGGTTAAFLQRFGQVGLATGEAWSETEEQAGADGDCEGEQKNGAVDVHLAQAGNGLRADTFHQVDGPVGKEDSERSAADRQHDTFRQALTEETRATGTNRDPNCHLPFACGGAGEEHGGEVGAGDEEDEPDRAEQDQKKRLHPADDLLLEGIKRRAKTVALRVVVLELRRAFP